MKVQVKVLDAVWVRSGQCPPMQPQVQQVWIYVPVWMKRLRLQVGETVLVKTGLAILY